MTHNSGNGPALPTLLNNKKAALRPAQRALRTNGHLLRVWRVGEEAAVHAKVNRIYHSLDEVLGESLNAIAKCRFKEQTDGFGKFMLFLH